MLFVGFGQYPTVMGSVPTSHISAHAALTVCESGVSAIFGLSTDCSIQLSPYTCRSLPGAAYAHTLIHLKGRYPAQRRNCLQGFVILRHRHTGTEVSLASLVLSAFCLRFIILARHLHHSTTCDLLAQESYRVQKVNSWSRSPPGMMLLINTTAAPIA